MLSEGQHLENLEDCFYFVDIDFEIIRVFIYFSVQREYFPFYHSSEDSGPMYDG